MAKIVSIDGDEYNEKDLSKKALEIVNSLRFLESKRAFLANELAYYELSKKMLIAELKITLK